MVILMETIRDESKLHLNAHNELIRWFVLKQSAGSLRWANKTEMALRVEN